jgi:phosphoenolpyruvate-protein kinase (PTS system EI component)
MRAILRAGVHGHCSMLFPMISTLEEVQRLKKMLHKTRLELQRAGVPHTEHMPVGVMIEVPAAALCIEDLLVEVDFVSIGSNDLLQYVMAADRDNPKVAHLCEPFAPAIMKLLQNVITACNARGKPVTLCGEMAGRPRCFLALFGMGLRRLSMSPAFVPTIKEMVRCTDCTKAKEIVAKVLHMKTAGEVRGYLTRITSKICPNVAFLDTRE